MVVKLQYKTRYFCIHMYKANFKTTCIFFVGYSLSREYMNHFKWQTFTLKATI